MKEVTVDISAEPLGSPGSSSGVVVKPAARRGANEEHCLYCFDVLAAQLRGEKKPEPSFDDLEDEYPLFVTWNTVSARGGTRLRGCIGNFEAQPIGTGLADYAIIAAMRDHRFSPIQLKELAKLSCGVSLLTDFEECDNAYDWSLGIHGVYIHLDEISPRRPRKPSKSNKLIQRGPGIITATFLPDVAPNQGWNQRETLDAAIRKAGWTGTIDEELRTSLRVVRYKSTKAEVGYAAWQTARGQA